MTPSTITVDQRGLDNVVRAILDGGVTVFTLNVAHMRMISSRASFRTAYLSANLVTLDSQLLNRWLLGGRGRVVPGSTLLATLIERELLSTERVFVVGNYSAEGLERVLAARQISCMAPSMGFGDLPAERDALVDAIRDAAPSLVLLCVGAPQSEELSVLIRRSVDPRVSILCCGAALDFVMGRRSRAPVLLQTMAMEWAWRLLHEPSRLWRRYLLDLQFLISSRPSLRDGRNLRVGDTWYRFGSGVPTHVDD